MKTLCYSEGLHEYTLDDNGEKTPLPSVTLIVGMLTGKDFSRIPSGVLDQARERGNKIHLDVEKGTLETREAQWIEKEISRQDCIFECMGYKEISGLAYAGRTDILQKDILFDVKTQAKPDMLAWTLQLNLYKQFFASVKKLKVLHTPKGEKSKVFEIPVLSEEKMEEMFVAYKTGKTLDKGFIIERAEDTGDVMDLVVYEQNSGTLVTNAQEILNAIRKKVGGYKVENYSVETVDVAARDKAKLNKLAKVLNDKRIKYERKHMEKINPELDIIKTACTEIKLASEEIDVLVSYVTNKARDEKKQQLINHFQEQNEIIVDFELIFEPCWLNKTVSLESAKEAVSERILKIHEDLGLLDRIGEPDAKAFYLHTLNFESAMEMADRIKENKEKLKKIEVVTVAQEASFSTEQNKAISKAEEIKPIIYTNPEKEAVDDLLERTMRVWGTIEQIIKLGNYMNENGITFRKLVGGDCD